MNEDEKKKAVSDLERYKQLQSEVVGQDDRERKRLLRQMHRLKKHLTRRAEPLLEASVNTTDPREALALVEQAIECNPLSNSPKDFRFLVQQLHCHQALGDENGMLRDCHDIIDLWPRNGDAQLMCARVFYGLELFTDALECFTAALPLLPEKAAEIRVFIRECQYRRCQPADQACLIRALPKDVVSHMLEFLDAVSLLRTAVTCSEMRALAMTPKQLAARFPREHVLIQAAVDSKRSFSRVMQKMIRRCAYCDELYDSGAPREKMRCKAMPNYHPGRYCALPHLCNCPTGRRECVNYKHHWGWTCCNQRDYFFVPRQRGGTRRNRYWHLGGSSVVRGLTTSQAIAWGVEGRNHNIQHLPIPQMEGCTLGPHFAEKTPNRYSYAGIVPLPRVGTHWFPNDTARAQSGRYTVDGYLCNKKVVISQTNRCYYSEFPHLFGYDW